jgi:hypothetical protein
MDNGQAAVVIHGHHHDLVFRKNTIGSTTPGAAGVGILPGKHARGLLATDNEFLNVKTAVQQGGE